MTVVMGDNVEYRLSVCYYHDTIIIAICNSRWPSLELLHCVPLDGW